jgi:hypothetical protein
MLIVQHSNAIDLSYDTAAISNAIVLLYIYCSIKLLWANRIAVFHCFLAEILAVLKMKTFASG